MKCTRGEFTIPGGVACAMFSKCSIFSFLTEHTEAASPAAPALASSDPAQAAGVRYGDKVSRCGKTLYEDRIR